MNNNELVYIATIIPVLLVITVIVIIVLFIRKKNKLLIEQQQKELDFLSEINKARIEVKDTILKQVAGELHDNIGQILALNCMYLKSIRKSYSEEQLDVIAELAAKALNEVRQLSRLLNDDLVHNYNLVDSIRKLQEYLSKLSALKINLEISGEVRVLDTNVELIIFRICQEFITNSLKHAQCDRIDITLRYNPHQLMLQLSDNGSGFNIQDISEGNGVLGFYNRAKIINARIEMDSVPGSGTTLSLVYNTPQQ
ncbi:sensor histidine kinase [Edaphocola aurantiacus]|nr:ATP-binding protein [Edaphocola aurantiacus]